MGNTQKVAANAAVPRDTLLERPMYALWKCILT